MTKVSMTFQPPKKRSKTAFSASRRSPPERLAPEQPNYHDFSYLHDEQRCQPGRFLKLSEFPSRNPEFAASYCTVSVNRAARTPLTVAEICTVPGWDGVV